MEEGVRRVKIRVAYGIGLKGEPRLVRRSCMDLTPGTKLVLLLLPVVLISLIILQRLRRNR